MLLQNNDMKGVFDNMFWHLKIRCTTKCNMYCRHCYAASEDYPYEPKELTNFEWVDRLAKNDRIKYIHLQGGEPTLAFNAMKECRKIGKKYNKPVSVFTNGKLLYEDKNFREKFTQEICPDILIVSFNKYLEEQTNQSEVVNFLASYYKDNQNIKFGTTAVIDNSNLKAMIRFANSDSWPSYDPKYYPEIEKKLNYNYWKFQLILENSSRAKATGVGSKDCAKCLWKHLKCSFSPTLTPSGFLLADCGCGNLKKTLLGYIDDFGDDPIEYLALHKSEHVINNPRIKINNYYEICEKFDNIKCLSEYPKHTLPEEEYIKRISCGL